MAVETTNTMIARGSATAPIRVVNVSAPVRASITCPPCRVSAPKPHVRPWGGTTPSTTSMMPLDQVWCELLSPTVTLRTSDPLSSFERLHLESSRAPKCPILDPLTVLQLTLRSPLTLSATVGLSSSSGPLRLAYLQVNLA